MFATPRPDRDSDGGPGGSFRSGKQSTSSRRSGGAGQESGKSSRRSRNSSSNRYSRRDANQIDYVKLNSRTVGNFPPRFVPKEPRQVDSEHGHRAWYDQGTYRQRPGYGKIPPYMRHRQSVERRQTREIEARMEEIARAEEGLRYSDEEKARVVKMLEEYLVKLNFKYQRLPLRHDLHHIIKRKEHLESLMDEVQRSIVFMTSTPVVYKSDFNSASLHEEMDKIFPNQSTQASELLADI